MSNGIQSVLEFAKKAVLSFCQQAQQPIPAHIKSVLQNKVVVDPPCPSLLLPSRASPHLESMLSFSLLLCFGQQMSSVAPILEHLLFARIKVAFSFDSHGCMLRKNVSVPPPERGLAPLDPQRAPDGLSRFDRHLRYPALADSFPPEEQSKHASLEYEMRRNHPPHSKIPEALHFLAVPFENIRPIKPNSLYIWLPGLCCCILVWLLEISKFIPFLGRFCNFHC